jgi:hypothetical protein
MRRLVIAMLSVALVASAAATADAAGTGTPRAHATVSPGTGTPSTRFAVHFRTPQRTGTFPAMRVWETVSATGPKSTSGCSGLAGTRVRPAAAHARLRVRLGPAGKPWCPGPYIGTVSVYRETRCQPGPVRQNRLCPLLAFAPERIGRFRFTVRRVQP